MDTTHTTITGIAVALAVSVALGIFFVFGTSTLSLPVAEDVAQATLPTSAATSLTPTTMNETNQTPGASDALPTELTGTDVVVGTGAEATKGSSVTVNYVGMFPDGTVFDASERHGKPFSFTLGAGRVISGWDMGVQGMKVGGKRRLIIPPQYGYGERGAPGAIPPNATLVFDIELLGVQ